MSDSAMTETECGDGANKGNTQDIVDAVYRTESRRVLATLIRLLGDFDAAEEAMHDAFTAAIERWPRDGVPRNPRAWLVSAGRFRAIDAMRRRSRMAAARESLAVHADTAAAPITWEDATLPDDALRLIFTCCHPALPADAQTALTLREVCGLTTESIASAFLSTPATIAQRIVRAKAKIRDAAIPYEVPGQKDLEERLDAVLRVIYLLYNEGYAATSGEELTRPNLSDEAIRLGRTLVELLPAPEAMGLLGLMLLHEARRPARTNADGDLILLQHQDRGLWNQRHITEGSALVEKALRSRSFGPYTLQGAIAAVHAEARDASSTDWRQIILLYGVLLQVLPSPVVELNRAVAIAMRDGPASGLRLVDAIMARGELTDYQPAHAARADLLTRMGKREEALQAFRAAIERTAQVPERRYLERCMQQLMDDPAVGG